MAEIIEDRVKESSISTGTGNISLAGALTGYRAFSSVCQVNDTFHACVVAVDANGNPTGDWEVGYYTYSAANTLARTTVRASSNSNGLVSFAAGTKHVFIDLPAYQIKGFATVGASNPSATPTITDASLPPSTFTSLTFFDDFNGNILDTTKWSAGTSTVPDNATQNFNVSGGCLNIWPNVDTNGNFFSRSIHTDAKAFQKYGFFEIRAKLPVGLGLWPGFVLESNQNGLSPRLDVLEAYPGGGTALPWGTSTNQPVNYRGNVMRSTSPAAFVDSRRYKDFITTPTTIMSDAFHVFGIYWTPDQVQYYFDGAKWGTPVTITTETNLQQQMFFILKLWVNSIDSGTATVAATPQGINNAYKIDYIRAWGLSVTGGTGSGGAGSGGQTIQQVVADQQATTHEATLIHDGTFSWAHNPSIITPGPFKAELPQWFKDALGTTAYNNLPASMTEFLSWFVVERGTAMGATTNAAVTVRDIRFYIYSDTGRNWTRYNLVGSPAVDLWRIEQYQPLRTANNVPSYIRFNADNTTTVRRTNTTYDGYADSSQMFHGYGSGVSGINTGDWRAAFIAIDHQLVMWDPAGANDLANAQYLVQSGGDHYPAGGNWPTGYAPGAAGGRFRIVKQEWQTSYCIIPYFNKGCTYNELITSPPPLGFLR